MNLPLFSKKEEMILFVHYKVLWIIDLMSIFNLISIPIESGVVAYSYKILVV